MKGHEIMGYEIGILQNLDSGLDSWRPLLVPETDAKSENQWTSDVMDDYSLVWQQFKFVLVLPSSCHAAYHDW